VSQPSLKLHPTDEPVREDRPTKTLYTVQGAQVWQILLFAVLIAVGLYLGYRAYTSIRALAARTQFHTIPFISDRDRESLPPDQLDPGTNPGGEPNPQPKATPLEIYPDIERQDRINILVLGIDQRPGEPIACRTDTMILVSVNPKTMTASLLSIPRDLWVPIRHPKHPEDRINTAHLWGEIENYPGGGPELAKDTVQYNFGVPVHYYLRINFTGFEQIIDRIGGIEVDVPMTIHDTKYPAPDNSYMTFHIDAGHHFLDGATALKYARTRQGGGDGDFTRMQRQQQVILAIRDRVLSLPNLPQLLPRLPQLYRDMGDSIETDIPTQMMFTMAMWAQKIDGDDIRMETIDRRMTYDFWTNDGRMVLAYDREKARPIIESLFSDPTPEATASSSSHTEKLEAENARVAVYNGTSNEGLASAVAGFLSMQGINIVQIGNADHFGYPRTLISVYADKPTTVAWLGEWLKGIGIPEPILQSPDVQPDWSGGAIDVAIILGADFPADMIN
jgi:LCP family protein required for cell wall assembly